MLACLCANEKQSVQCPRAVQTCGRVDPNTCHRRSKSAAQTKHCGHVAAMQLFTRETHIFFSYPVFPLPTCTRVSIFFAFLCVFIGQISPRRTCISPSPQLSSFQYAHSLKPTSSQHTNHVCRSNSLLMQPCNLQLASSQKHNKRKFSVDPIEQSSAEAD